MFRNTVLLLAALFWLSAQPVSAGSITEKQITKEKATQLAQQRFPGKIVRVQAEKRHYKVRLLQPDGRVVTVLVDSRTGQVHRDDN